MKLIKVNGRDFTEHTGPIKPRGQEMSRSECREAANKEAGQSVCAGLEGESSAALALSKLRKHFEGAELWPLGARWQKDMSPEPRKRQPQCSCLVQRAKAPSLCLLLCLGFVQPEGTVRALFFGTCFDPLLLETALRQN